MIAYQNKFTSYNNEKKIMVIWVVGLSASGKTSLCTALVKQLRENDRKVVLLDGDVIRELFNNDVDHSMRGRLLNAERLSKLTKFLSDQNIDVVAAVLSVSKEWRKWNRSNVKDYKQVYLKTSMDVLIRRETKGLYENAIKGNIKNVVGIDIEFIPPEEDSDIIINNDVDLPSLDSLASEVIEKLNIK